MEAQQVSFDCNGAVLRWKGVDRTVAATFAAIDRESASHHFETAAM
jgi:hypothetical protein